jgi:hypothetical protein
MTDYRLRNPEFLGGERRPPPSLRIAAFFAAIGFIAMFAALSGLTNRFSLATDVSGTSAPAASTTVPDLPHP